MATYTKEKDVETVLEDDIEARNTMQEVFSNTARWPAGFGGFAADVVANINGEEKTILAASINIVINKYIYDMGNNGFTYFSYV